MSNVYRIAGIFTFLHNTFIFINFLTRQFDLEPCTVLLGILLLTKSHFQKEWLEIIEDLQYYITFISFYIF